jgi:hypothetical protein
VLEVLQEISKVPVATRAWRGVASEAFSDNKFFALSPDVGRKWNLIVNSLQVDKQSFTELLSRVSATPPATLFSNREAEIFSKMLSLRRLSITMFVAETNQYVNHLPAIQEKLVDLLKSGMSPLLHAEVCCQRRNEYNTKLTLMIGLSLHESLTLSPVSAQPRWNLACDPD